jgi:BlaI family penicillinase repressor
MADKSVALADTEWSIMQIIWDSNPITFREICDVIAETKGWSKHSVASYLKRMEKKGAIMSEPSTSVKKYYPILIGKAL